MVARKDFPAKDLKELIAWFKANPGKATAGMIGSGGIGFSGALTILFIGLKLGKVIDWSWWWVLSPIWIPVAAYLDSRCRLHRTFYYRRLYDWNCSCYRFDKEFAKMKEPIPIGKRFKRLVILSYVGVSKNMHRVVLCKCDCGNEYEAFYHRLKSGITRSCGCEKTHIDFRGEFISRAAFAVMCGITKNTLGQRKFRGWTLEEIYAGKRGRK